MQLLYPVQLECIKVQPSISIHAHQTFVYYLSCIKASCVLHDKIVKKCVSFKKAMRNLDAELIDVLSFMRKQRQNGVISVKCIHLPVETSALPAEVLVINDRPVVST